MLKSLVAKKLRIRRRKIGYKNWWDRSYTKKKRKVKRMFKKWKQGNINKESFWNEKKEWRKMVEEKKGKKKEEEHLELKSLKNEAEV